MTHGSQKTRGHMCPHAPHHHAAQLQGRCAARGEEVQVVKVLVVGAWEWESWRAEISCTPAAGAPAAAADTRSNTCRMPV